MKGNVLHSLYFFLKNTELSFLWQNFGWKLRVVMSIKWLRYNGFTKESKNHVVLIIFLSVTKFEENGIWNGKSLKISWILISPSLHWGKYFVDTKEGSSKYRKTIFGMGGNIYNQ